MLFNSYSESLVNMTFTISIRRKPQNSLYNRWQESVHRNVCYLLFLGTYMCDHLKPESKLFMTVLDTVTLNNAFEHAQYLVQYLVSCISIWYY